TEIKFQSPWYCRTPPGYSIRILPCFYFFEYLWTTLPGMVHTDRYHSTHADVIFDIEEGQIVIPRGTPFAHIGPFRREFYDLDVHLASEADADRIDLRNMEELRYLKRTESAKEERGHFS
ncbi:MAG: hypothetical protein AAF733_09590, partial [Verrucomicrobiota bacterium]